MGLLALRGPRGGPLTGWSRTTQAVRNFFASAIESACVQPSPGLRGFAGPHGSGSSELDEDPHCRDQFHGFREFNKVRTACALPRKARSVQPNEFGPSIRRPCGPYRLKCRSKVLPLAYEHLLLISNEKIYTARLALRSAAPPALPRCNTASGTGV